MPLLAMHRCQICGDVLFHDDFFSDPSQHVCLTVNGPGMKSDPHANGCDIIKSDLFTKTPSAPKPAPKKREIVKVAEIEHLSESESDTSSSLYSTDNENNEAFLLGGEESRKWNNGTLGRTI
ncbi:hypothetical protein Q7P37_003965 [Cladosporium fusiforme]